MAQGNMKLKARLPGGTKRKSPTKKPSTVHKKGIYIKPKKMQKVEAEKLRKNLEKTINQNIEDKLRAKASGQNGKRFNVNKAGSSKKTK
ncbi:Uncharacterised protein g9055 [Pycnogonum litorale]